MGWAFGKEGIRPTFPTVLPYRNDCLYKKVVYALTIEAVEGIAVTICCAFCLNG